ncbi:hypothetical protein [Hymenobacter sp. BT730]|uniref:hypothetical protein n=1 Tax=Hymenobacter sp. BT730 TaxID=3063332 RepID=UPI0026DEC351|nr:hypothetical protein [Hymenobacter sp. BT730]
MKFRFDKSLFRTVLFSVALVAFIIATYQTIEQNDKNAVMDNYWLFMLSFSCLLLYRFLGRKPVTAPPTTPPAPAKNTRKTPAARPRARK